MTAAYRFFDNEKVTFDLVLGPHSERTLERIAEQSTVLLVQDTTELDFTRRGEVESGVSLRSTKRLPFGLAGAMWGCHVTRRGYAAGPCWAGPR